MLCFAGSNICVSIADSTLSLARKALDSDGGKRIAAVNDAISHWEKYSPWLLAVQYHDQVEDVRLELEAIRQCALNGFEEEFYSRIAELEILLERVRDANSLKLSEIL